MAFLVWLNANLNLLKNPYLNGVDEYKPQLPSHLLIQKPASLDDLKFVFSQVEKRVKETADDGDRINAKSLTLITVCLTFITALIGFIVSKLKGMGVYDVPLALTAFYVIIELTIVVVNLKENIYPVAYQSIGSKPSDLLVTEMFDEDDEKDDTPEWKMLYSEILSFEERVMLNDHNNGLRNNRLKKAYDSLYRIPIFSAVCCVVTLLLLFCFGSFG